MALAGRQLGALLLSHAKRKARRPVGTAVEVLSPVLLVSVLVRPRPAYSWPYIESYSVQVLAACALLQRACSTKVCCSWYEHLQGT